MIYYMRRFVKAMIARGAVLLVDVPRAIIIVKGRLFLLPALELVQPCIPARNRLCIYPFEKFGRILGGVFHSHRRVVEDPIVRKLTV